LNSRYGISIGRISTACKWYFLKQDGYLDSKYLLF
jgi:hypothetical protein